MSGSAHEETFTRKVHWSQFRVRLEKEPVGVERDAQEIGQLMTIGPRFHSRGEHNQVRDNDEFPAKRRLVDDHFEFAVAREARRIVGLIPHKQNALFPGFTICDLAETVGANVSVENHHTRTRVSLLQLE